MNIINKLPIKWFGDRNAYNQSSIKVVTVGLNPSDKEFREKDGDSFSTSLRFPEYNGNALDIALNNYFKRNPYNWFNSFEHILNGLDASYWDKKEFPNRALHTDICSPWATDPTWSNLSKNDKAILLKDGFPEWEKLIDHLKPDVLIFSIPQEYINLLNITLSEFYSFTVDKNGNQRKKPLIIQEGRYNVALSIFGKTRNIPFGALGSKQKEELGKLIKQKLPK